METKLLSLGEWIIMHLIPFKTSENAEKLSEEELEELEKIREEKHIWR
ncbi:hypothetical protein JEZ13_01710 [bacterium]|nr:hypothetical protein [bacterium]